MNRRGFIELSSASFLLGALSGCQTGLTRSFRFRMTVDVSTPQGLKTGSAVYESYLAPFYDPLRYSQADTGGFRGQAAIVELPAGPLFVLAVGNDVGQQGSIDDTAFKILAGGYFTGEVVTEQQLDAVSRLGRTHVKAELPKSIRLNSSETMPTWPTMVRFRDLNDPNSVEAVDSDQIGVEHIWLETTHDPVTVGIARRFPPWFTDLVHSHRPLSGRTSNGIVSNNSPMSLADTLSAVEFSTEYQ